MFKETMRLEKYFGFEVCIDFAVYMLKVYYKSIVWMQIMQNHGHSKVVEVKAKFKNTLIVTYADITQPTILKLFFECNE